MPEKIVIKINGEDVNVTSDLVVGPDLDRELDRGSALVAKYGRLLSRAQNKEAQCLAEYRHWRARQTETILQADPKLAEWKVKAKVESLPQFLQHKEDIASAEEETHGLWGVYEAVCRRCDLLQSRNSRDVRNLSTLGTDGLPGEEEIDKAEKTRRVSEIVGRKKKSKTKGAPTRERPKKTRS